MKLKKTMKYLFLLALTGVIFLLCVMHFSKRPNGDKSDQTSSVNENPDLKKLSSLGYVVWTPIAAEDLNKSGVTKYNPKLACNGVNLYYSENIKGGHFLDMQGNILHSFKDKRRILRKKNWLFMEPYHDEEFLVIIQTKEIFRIDWNSKVKKRYTGPFHHDVSVTDDGSIYTMMHEIIDSPEFCTTEPLRNDLLVLIRKNGEIEKKASFAKMIQKDKILFDIVRNRKKTYEFGKDAWDIFHTNSVEIINRDVFAGDRKLFKKGNILCCIRNQDLIVVIDIEEKKIVWYWGLNEVSLPHHASLLENGNILIVDNGTNRKYTRIVEVNPATKKIVWEYKADPPDSFYTSTRGSAQRLPNGNTLIAESAKGHVFEVTRDGTIVWEFYNPEISEVTNKKTGKKEKKRATIYRMLRVVELQQYPKLGTK